MYQEGDLIANFIRPGVNAQGAITDISFKDLLQTAPLLILYVYPKDDTPGCTGEACDFRDAQPQWAPQAALAGLSPDPPASHQAFYANQKLNFPLLSYESLTLIKQLGAYGEKKLYGRVMQGVIRSTFLINAEGRMIKAFRGVKAKGHAARMMQELAAMAHRG